jgi:hypothetical protein
MAILDVVIGLVFVYLILSLACTAMTEVLAQWLNTRAVTLHEGIWTLLTGRPGNRPPWNRAPADEPLRSAKAELEKRREALRSLAGAAFDRYEAADANQRKARSLAAVAAGEAAAAERRVRRAADVLHAVSLSGDTAGRPVAQAALNSARVECSMRRAACTDARVNANTAERAFAEAERELARVAAEPLRSFIDAREALVRARGAAVVRQLYAHPIIAGLSQSRRRLLQRVQLPSYIPAHAFSAALTDIVSPAAEKGPPTLAALREAAGELPEQLRKPLLLFVDEAAGDVERFRWNLERWYTDAMERVSGLYKRKAQAVVLGIALAIALATNADTVRIARVLVSNAALRDSVVERATTATTAGADVNALIARLRFVGIPLGWGVTEEQRAALARAPRQDYPAAWLKVYAPLLLHGLPGLLLTTLALSLGAPFWFDVLNRVINIRAAGRAPEEKPKPPEALPPPRGA